MDNQNTYLTIGIGIGMCFGAAIGQFLFDNMATGLGIGLTIGIGVGMMIDKRKNGGSK